MPIDVAAKALASALGFGEKKEEAEDIQAIYDDELSRISNDLSFSEVTTAQLMPAKCGLVEPVIVDPHYLKEMLSKIYGSVLSVHETVRFDCPDCGYHWNQQLTDTSKELLEQAIEDDDEVVCPDCESEYIIEYFSPHTFNEIETSHNSKADFLALTTKHFPDVHSWKIPHKNLQKELLALLSGIALPETNEVLGDSFHYTLLKLNDLFKNHFIDPDTSNLDTDEEEYDDEDDDY